MKKYLVIGIVLFWSNLVSAKNLSLALAKDIAASGETYGKKKGWALSIAIVNDEGNLLYFQRGDKAYLGSVDAAISKAESANAFQRPTSAFAQSIKDGRTGLLSVRGVVALEGGVPIVIDGLHVGAIGISGAKSAEDEEAAIAALRLLETKKQ